MTGVTILKNQTILNPLKHRRSGVRFFLLAQSSSSQRPVEHHHRDKAEHEGDGSERDFLASRFTWCPPFVEALAACMAALPGGFAGLGVFADFLDFFAMSRSSCSSDLALNL